MSEALCHLIEPRWYCAWTHPTQEQRAAADLGRLGFRAYLPLHLDRPPGHPERARVIPLFSRYLFLSFDVARDQWRRIYRAQGVAGLIGSSPERPTPTPLGVIERLIERTSDAGIVDDPGPWRGAAGIVPGQHARAVDGPFAALTGVCQASARGRVEMLMMIFGRPTSVTFRPAQLETIT